MRWLPVSATAMRVPSGDQAANNGRRNSPSPVPFVPKLNANVPLAWKTLMRWLPLSGMANAPDPTARTNGAAEGSELPVTAAVVAAATAGGGARYRENGGGSRMPRSGGGGSEAWRCTWATCPPPPTPGDANLPISVPSTLNACTRSLLVSATAIMRPDGDQAADRGPSNCPSPVPFIPKLRSNVPSGQNTCTRLLPVSATAIMPSGDTATPAGDENCPSPEPDEPNTKAGSPSIWNTCTRLLPVSATAII